jgi:hypothetical protein
MDKPSFGRLLVAGGYITEEQLGEARAEQVGEPGRFLGEILVARGWLTTDQLVEAALPQLGAPAPALPPRVGEVLVGCGLITPAELDTALAHQRRHGGKVGAALVQQRVVSQRQIETTLRRTA